ncbi:MAG TPA: pyrroloquinoline quinone biosynthesis protein PqqB [Stellaceae bacterium]|jgi:pyrroloquinoline quinone biosynthesis protein B|nr:pyrroloquinoline quinone biosynthesis protein PqqB [Stellaceae bacterium]
MVRAVVLGSAAGGGFPQWNSNAPACRRARRGDPEARVRSQASLAVSSNNKDWVLLNASPDLRLQIEAAPQLYPCKGLRSSPITGVVLTGGDVDAIAGLLHLRERHRFNIYAPSRVLAIIAANPIFDVLAPDFVRRIELPLDERMELAGASGASGLAVIPFAVPGKLPLYLETAGQDPGLSEEGDAVGLEIIETATGKSFFFVPGCAAITEQLRARLAGSALVFFDGTLWSDDEMIRLAVGSKTGKRMGHMSMSGEDGTIAAFHDLGVGRRIFIHINNSNPVLLDDSPERHIANAAGWEIAYDGMEVTL